MKTKEEILKELKGKEYLIHNVDPVFLNDDDIVSMCVRKHGSLLKIVNDRFKNDKEFIKSIVSDCGLALLHASDELKDDKEIVTIAIKENVFAFDYASNRLKKDKDIINLFKEGIKDKDLIKNIQEKFIKYFDGGSLEKFPDIDTEEYIIDKEGIGIGLSTASFEVTDDKYTVLKALETSPMSIIFASSELKNDQEIINFAMKKNPLIKELLNL